MRVFDNIKKLTDNWKFKESLRPLYQPFLERLKYYMLNRNFHTQGSSVYKESISVLGSLNINFWLEFGTLLGYYRDGDLIMHDTDIDFGVYLKDYSEQIEKTFISAGFTKMHDLFIEDGSGRELSFVKNNISVDLFFFSEKDGKMICHLFPISRETQKRYAREICTEKFSLVETQFKGEKVYVSSNIEQRLIDTYGKEYKVPDKNWYTPEDALNSKIIEKSITIAS